MLVDTNVFFDYLSGNELARKFLNSQVNLYTSSIVKMEMIQGVRKKSDIIRVEKFLEEKGVEVLEINQDVSEQAYKILKENYHESNLGIADALLAAVAIYSDLTLITLNIKHFVKIKDLKVKKPY